MIVVAVAVAVLLVSGISAYAVTTNYRKGDISQSCDTYQCIPRLKAETVVKALEERGHTCSTDYNHQTCKLRIGAFYFEATLQVAAGLITRINLRVYREQSAPLTPGSVAYIKWFAALPYRDDPVLTGQIEEWVDQQIEATEDTKATIGDYEYVLANPETYNVTVEIKGKY